MSIPECPETLCLDLVNDQDPEHQKASKVAASAYAAYLYKRPGAEHLQQRVEVIMRLLVEQNKAERNGSSKDR